MTNYVNSGIIKSTNYIVKLEKTKGGTIRMKLKWEELDLGNGKKRYLVTTGEFIVLPTLKEGPTCSGPCGGFEASISEQYKNVCVTDMEFESFEIH